MRYGSDPWVRKIPWRRAWQPTPIFLPGESHGQRSLVGCTIHRVTESDTTEATWHACKATTRWPHSSCSSCPLSLALSQDISSLFLVPTERNLERRVGPKVQLCADCVEGYRCVSTCTIPSAALADLRNPALGNFMEGPGTHKPWPGFWLLW